MRASFTGRNLELRGGRVKHSSLALPYPVLRPLSTSTLALFFFSLGREARRLTRRHTTVATGPVRNRNSIAKDF